MSPLWIFLGWWQTGTIINAWIRMILPQSIWSGEYCKTCKSYVIAVDQKYMSSSQLGDKHNYFVNTTAESYRIWSRWSCFVQMAYGMAKYIHNIGVSVFMKVGSLWEEANTCQCFDLLCFQDKCGCENGTYDYKQAPITGSMVIVDPLMR